jgi:hypothetical protein
MTEQNGQVAHRDRYAHLNVDFAFDVGTSEKHHVEFHWGASWAEARIIVDGEEVLCEKHPFGVKNVRRYEVSVGESELHLVVIENQKARLYGALRKRSFRAFIDGNLIVEY